MGNQLIDQFVKGLTWKKAWSMRLRLMDSKNRLPRGFPAFKLRLSVEGPHEANFKISLSVAPARSILDVPEVMLEQLSEPAKQAG